MIQEPILKIQWERFKNHIDIDISKATKLVSPWTTHKIKSLELLSGGCTNTNYKIVFEDISPVVLRIYVREKGALQREYRLNQLIKNITPVPAFLYINDSGSFIDYDYALTEWIDGTLMRDVLLSEGEKAISQCAFSAGQHLDRLRKIKFRQGGFFENNLVVRPFKEAEKYLPFGLIRLKDESVQNSLSLDTLSELRHILERYGHLLPDINDANLTHGDFDPANMLVRKIDKQWRVTALLDWEFAFVGSYLMDMGMMLRYAHKLPTCYERSFIDGLKSTGQELPDTWKQSAKLMDLLCLLNLLYYNPLNQRPRINRDLVSLLEDTVTYFRSFDAGSSR